VQVLEPMFAEPPPSSPPSSGGGPGCFEIPPVDGPPDNEVAAVTGANHTLFHTVKTSRSGLFAKTIHAVHEK
jgi:hypothetical protein